MCEAVYQSNSCCESSGDQMSPTHSRMAGADPHPAHGVQRQGLHRHDGEHGDDRDPCRRPVHAFGRSFARARCLRL